MADPVRLELLDDLGDLLDGPRLAGVDGDPQVVPAHPLEEVPILLDPEAGRLRARDVDPDDPPVAPADRLLRDDLVELVGEGTVQAEDQPRPDRVLEDRPVHAAHRRRDDVVKVLLAAAVPLHRVEPELHRGDIVLAICAAHHLVDRALDRDRRRLDQLRPVEEVKVAVERVIVRVGDRDHVPELPVVLGREPDPLAVGDAPHDRGCHCPAQVTMELRERRLAREQAGHAHRIAGVGPGAPRRQAPCAVRRVPAALMR